MIVPTTIQQLYEEIWNVWGQESYLEQIATLETDTAPHPNDKWFYVYGVLKNGERVVLGKLPTFNEAHDYHAWLEAKLWLDLP